MRLTPSTALAILVVGLLAWFAGSRRHDTFAQDKPGKSGVRVLIAGSIKVEGGGQPRKVTIEGKGFKAQWHDTADVQVKEIALPAHWHVTFEKAPAETPVVVATPCDEDVFSVTLIQTNKKGFRVAGKTSLRPFGFTFIVVQR